MVSNKYCVEFLLCLSSSCCKFLWIVFFFTAPSIFSNVYLLVYCLMFGWWSRPSALFNIWHDNFSVSWILNILCLKFKIIAFFIITLFARLHARVGILLTCGKLMHDRIISPTGEVCAHKTCLTPPHFIEMHVPSKKVSGHVFVC
jgi:hypothetical protein